MCVKFKQKYIIPDEFDEKIKKILFFFHLHMFLIILESKKKLITFGK